jgi:asparagine synthase (glutamine-hydrolysing)
MTFWAPLSPETIFQEVVEVSPGEMVSVQDQQLIRRRYWDWTFPEDNQYRTESAESLSEELHALMIDATRIRLRSDVPVGAYLSGGLDSSVLTSLIYHYGGVPLRTFSIGFSDESLDETPYQRMMIEHLHADHSSIACTPADIGKAFLDTVWHIETPVVRTAPTPMRLLSGLVRSQSYKVVLTGEGADEVFGGYDLFKEGKIRYFWARHPTSALRPLLLKHLYPYLDVSPGRAQSYLKIFFGESLDQPELPYFAHIPRWSTTSKCKEFFSSSLKEGVEEDSIARLSGALPESIGKWHPFNRAQYVEAKTLLPGYLLSSQGDRMLMANSVEGRFPFLDHRLIEFASRVHPKLKMKVLDEKHLLKLAASRYLPASIVHRYKQPYRAPDIPAFFDGDPPEYVNELLSKHKLTAYGYFDPTKVDLLIKKIQRKMAIGYRDNMALVAILSTQAWHYHFIERYGSNFGVINP